MGFLRFILSVLEDMELYLFGSMARNLQRHKAEEERHGMKWPQWQAIQAQSLRAFRKEYAKAVDMAFREVVPLAEKLIRDAYDAGADTWDREHIERMKALGREIPWAKLPGAPNPPPVLPPVKGASRGFIKGAEKSQAFFQINRPKIEAVIKDVHTDMNKARYAAAARMGAIHEQTIARADMYFQTGTMSLSQAVNKATVDAAAEGLNCVRYSDGRMVSLQTYAEMALRTSSMRARLTAMGVKRNEWGIYTVCTSVINTTCPTCQKWQGRVMIDDVYANGKRTEEEAYPLLSEAIAEGFLHPNCRHTLTTFHKGISPIPTQAPLDKTRKAYEAEQRQRYIERRIRKAKRKIAADDRKEHQDELKKWQAHMREHLKANPDLRRKPDREQIPGVLAGRR